MHAIPGRVRVHVAGWSGRRQHDFESGLGRQPGVRSARANPRTGNVLIHFDPAATDERSILGAVRTLTLHTPTAPREQSPLPTQRAKRVHAPAPDGGALLQSAARTGGAAAGFGVLAARRLAGSQDPPVSGAIPVVTAGTIGVLESFPVVRDAVRKRLGPEVAELLLGVASIASLTLAGSSLGLAVSGLAALRLLTEVRARQAAWRRHEAALQEAAPAEPGATIRLEAGEKTPLAARVVEGTGSTAGRDGLPVPVTPGEAVAAGARLYGGPFVLKPQGGTSSLPGPRRIPPTDPEWERFAHALTPLSFAYAALTLLWTRSPTRAFAALLLVNPRVALLGGKAAEEGASARVLRAGATVVGTRAGRTLRRPAAVLLDSPRVLTDGFEVDGILPLTAAGDANELLGQATAVAAAAGSPWGSAFRGASSATITEGAFDGKVATACIEGMRYSLGPAEDRDAVPTATQFWDRGEYPLLLRGGDEQQMLALLALRPRLAPGVESLVDTCRQHGVELAVLAGHDPGAGRALARRAGISLLAADDAIRTIQARQTGHAPVAFLSDTPDAAAAFAACDLGVGISDGRCAFPARADLLAPDLRTVAAIIEAGAHRDAAVRDSLALSLLANGVGALWGIRGNPDIRRSSYPMNLAALGALGTGWVRLRGGDRTWSAASQIVDPHPERWGRQSTESVLRAFESTEAGLSSTQAAARRRAAQTRTHHRGLSAAILDQLRSPLTGMLAGGAGLSLFFGDIDDAVMIGAMILANAGAGAWQEHRTQEAAEALERMGTAVARVLRDGQDTVVPAGEVVPGDVMLLAPGDRVAADARLLSAEGLEVDEAALTGESLPVPKAALDGIDASRIVLEGSDVVVGSGRAVVVAVGPETRMGATAAALALDEAEQQSPLTARLTQLLRQFLPAAAAGGAIVAASGLLRKQPLPQQLALGASVALAAVPEGLTLLAALGESAVADRLARRNALVRRPAAVEALGRVDVVCTDKTGTLTEGRLALGLIADLDREVRLPALLPPDLRHVLLTGALAGPHPDALDATTDRTDAAVSEAAEDAGLGRELYAAREGVSPFDTARAFHAAVVGGRLCVEGAAEALAPRCTHLRRDGTDHPLDGSGSQELLTRATQLAERGLRVLLVAEGAPDTPGDDPHGLVALGFLGISDPLRPGVPAAVRRCHEAGLRVIMLTGDHPATARTIAREAGLVGEDSAVLTGTEITEMRDDELDVRLERATVIARATPADKLRIVESLQRRGHVVAMTGDGVNDAPALRLADVGVAMGRNGTEVARHAADVVLADDDFSTLVETFVEGRSFWRNIRRALGLLLGGNLGELGLQSGASVLGLPVPLTSHQILAMNLITDVLPALGIVLQQPEHHHLATLAREGTSALEAPLRHEVFGRSAATAGPSLAAYLLALRSGTPLARTIAYTTIITTQLAQTLDAGRTRGGRSRSVQGVVAGSAGLLAGTLAIQPVRKFLGLVPPTPFGWVLVGAATGTAVMLGRTLASPGPAEPGLA